MAALIYWRVNEDDLAFLGALCFHFGLEAFEGLGKQRVIAHAIEVGVVLDMPDVVELFGNSALKVQRRELGVAQQAEAASDVVNWVRLMRAMMRQGQVILDGMLILASVVCLEALVRQFAHDFIAFSIKEITYALSVNINRRRVAPVHGVNLPILSPRRCHHQECAMEYCADY